MLSPQLTGDGIVALSKTHTIYEWSAQSKADPIPVARAKGIYFWTPDKRYIDFNSQLMCVNIGVLAVTTQTFGQTREQRAWVDVKVGIGLPVAAEEAYAYPFTIFSERAGLTAI